MAAASAGSLAATGRSLNIVTINHSVALPGVVLPPGRYAFEVANPGTSADVVRITSHEGRQVHFAGLTLRVARPRTLARDQVLSVDEAPGGGLSIRTWYPQGESYGHEFLR